MDVDNWEHARGDDACPEVTSRVPTANRVVTRPKVKMTAVMPTAKTKIVELAMASFHLSFFRLLFSLLVFTSCSLH